MLGDDFGSESLRKVLDWHDHDGIITPEEECSWERLRSWVGSIDALRPSCSDDWRVHTLVYPTNLGFCLRYWIETEHEHACCIDLSARTQTLERVTETLRAQGVNSFEIEPSADYFAKRDGS